MTPGDPPYKPDDQYDEQYICPQCNGDPYVNEAGPNETEPDWVTCLTCKGRGTIEPTHHPGESGLDVVPAMVDLRDPHHVEEYDVENAFDNPLASKLFPPSEDWTGPVEPSEPGWTNHPGGGRELDQWKIAYPRDGGKYNVKLQRFGMPERVTGSNYEFGARGKTMQGEPTNMGIPFAGDFTRSKGRLPDWADVERLIKGVFDEEREHPPSQHTLPMHDESLDETEGWTGVKPVQQWHSGSKPDVTRIMSGKHDKDKQMWTGVGGDEEAQQRARGWARGMTQGGPGGHLVGVRGDKPQGEIAHGPADIDYADETGETGMRTISGKDINPHSLVFKPLPTPPPAQEMGEAQHSEEEKEAARDRLKEIEREIAHGGDSNEDEFNELNAILQSKPEPIGPEYRYDDEANEWVLVKQYGQEPSFETRQVEEAPPETDESLDVGTDVSMEENDPCCEQARQNWLDRMRWDDKPGFEGGWEAYKNAVMNGSCEGFRRLIDNFVLGSADGELGQPNLYANEKKIATEVLQEWNACAEQQFSGDIFTAGHGSAGVLVKHANHPKPNATSISTIRST